MTVILKKGDKERFGLKKLISNFKGHSRTVREHRRKVFEHCVKAGIPLQGLLHDLSKYSPTEFLCGVRYYQGTRSPNEGERDAYGFSYAWMHHKGRNKHHFEYWTDYDPVTKRMSPVKMPVRYLKEMFCDRVAASKIYNGDKYTDGDALAYFMKSRDRRLQTRMIDPDTSRMLEKLLRMLAEKGEEKTFAYLRRLRRY